MNRLCTMGMLTSVIVAAGAASFTGCGSAAEKASEKAAEEAIERNAASQGMKADVDIKDGGAAMTFQADTENGAVSVETGENVQLPKGFPEDVPTYPGMTVKMAQSAEQKGSFNVVASTSDSVESVVKKLQEKAEAAGWTQQASYGAAQMKSLSYTKADRKLSIVVSGAGTETNITLTTQSE